MPSRRRPSLPGAALVAVVASLTCWTAVAPAGVARAAPTQAGPELAAGPATDLVDGQEITVTGTGFAPHQALDIHQCAAADLIGLVDCDLGTVHRVTAAADGSVSTRMQVHAVIDSWARPGVDCREPGTCMLATDISFQDVGAAVTAPLAFDPDAAEQLPAVTVSPGDGLVDRQAVTVEGRGFTRSERPLVRVRQCGHTADQSELFCDLDSRQTADLSPDGRSTARLAVSTTLGREERDDRVDCRTAAAACYLEVTAAGRVRTARTQVRAPLAFDPDATIPDWPAPRITVTPTTGLADTQAITVRGTGVDPSANLRFYQCRADQAHDPELCFRPTLARPAVDPQGAFETEVVVHHTIFGSDVDCRAAPGCVVVARGHGIEQATPLRFATPEPPVRYLDPVFDEVDVTRDVVYRETVDHHGNPVELKLDIYRPRGDVATSRPATVWMHGGFFQGGSKDEMESNARASARRGQVGVSLQYRLRPDAAGNWRAMYLASLDAYDDATAGVEWLQEHAGQYGIDPDAIVAGGFSAGAVTALNLAYLPGQRGPATSRVAAAIPDSGLLYTPPERGEPPTIAFHGIADTITPYDNVAPLCQQAALVDVPCELHAFAGYGHGIGQVEMQLWRSSAFLVEHVLGPRGYFDVTADAGGPDEVAEGSTVALDATASAGDGLRHAWTPAERFDDPSSPTPRVTGRDDGTETLGLTVTSSHGLADRAEARLTTTNVAPSITELALPSAATARTVGLEATVTDPGLLDTHTATVDWGDGTAGSVTVEQDGGSARVLGHHTYARPGAYEVTLTVADDDGGTDGRTTTVVVRCWGGAPPGSCGPPS